MHLFKGFNSDVVQAFVSQIKTNLSFCHFLSYSKDFDFFEKPKKSNSWLDFLTFFIIFSIYFLRFYENKYFLWKLILCDFRQIGGEVGEVFKSILFYFLFNFKIVLIKIWVKKWKYFKNRLKDYFFFFTWNKSICIFFVVFERKSKKRNEIETRLTCKLIYTY